MNNIEKIIVEEAKRLSVKDNRFIASKSDMEKSTINTISGSVDEIAKMAIEVKAYNAIYSK